MQISGLKKHLLIKVHHMAYYFVQKLILVHYGVIALVYGD